MNTKTRNTIVGVIVIVIVIGVIYYIYTNKETFRGPIKKYEYMDEIDMSEETKDKEGNMNKLVNEQLDNYPEDVIVGEKADTLSHRAQLVDCGKRAFDFLVADIYRAVKVEHKQFHVFDIFHFVLCAIEYRFDYAAILSRIPLANAKPISPSLIAPARRIHSSTSAALISLLSQ